VARPDNRTPEMSMDSSTLPHVTPSHNPILQEAVPCAHATIQTARSSAERRKMDLVALADFGARTSRRWLVRDVWLALRREGLMTPALAHIVPTAVLDDPAPYLAEALRGDACWIVAEAYDALRLESYGFPALATEAKTALTLGDLHGCRWVILLQRPGEEDTLSGLDVRGELLRLGWAGTLTAIVLPFTDLDVAEAECGPECFGIFLTSLLTHATTQHLAGDRHHSANGNGQPAHTPQIGPRGFRTIAAGEVPSWRR
jgi:hypothetical protein